MLRKLALFIIIDLHNGVESDQPGVDFEFTKNDMYFLVSMQSRIEWNYSSTDLFLIQALCEQEEKIIRILPNLKIRKVIGEYLGHSQPTMINNCTWCIKGKSFWELISGDANFYFHHIQNLIHQAINNNEDFVYKRDGKENILTKDFIKQYCDLSWSINWKQIYNK